MERVTKDFTSEVALKGYDNKVILQHGEVTGHHHLLQSKGEIADYPEVFQGYSGTDMFLAAVKLEDEGVITHHEHWTQVVPAGNYVKAIQVAYEPFSEKNNPVLD